MPLPFKTECPGISNGKSSVFLSTGADLKGPRPGSLPPLFLTTTPLGQEAQEPVCPSYTRAAMLEQPGGVQTVPLLLHMKHSPGSLRFRELAALRLRKAGHSGASGQTPNNLLQPQETSKMSFPEALALRGTAAALCAVLSCLRGGGYRISHCNET